MLRQNKAEIGVKGNKFLKKISTQLLTVLIICVILQIEQRERNKRKPESRFDFPSSDNRKTNSSLQTAHDDITVPAMKRNRNI